MRWPWRKRDDLRECREGLERLVERLDRVLVPAGFAFRHESNDVGLVPFANGYYESDLIRIGLIVRASREGIGRPIYLQGDASAGHDELIDELGRSEDSVLRFSRFPFRWEDIPERLATDLETIVLPSIRNDGDAFGRAVRTCHEKWMADLPSSLREHLSIDPDEEDGGRSRGH